MYLTLFGHIMRGVVDIIFHIILNFCLCNGFSWLVDLIIYLVYEIYYDNGMRNGFPWELTIDLSSCGWRHFIPLYNGGAETCLIENNLENPATGMIHAIFAIPLKRH